MKPLVPGPTAPSVWRSWGFVTTFATALAVSAAGVVVSPAGLETWMIAPLIIFGGGLFVYRLFRRSSLPPDVQDAPYFLGFILTLLALGKVFWSISERTGGLVSGDLSQLVQTLRDVAIALLATVIGLGFRQLLVARDVAEPTDLEVQFGTFGSSLAHTMSDDRRAHEKFLETLVESAGQRLEQACSKGVKAIEDAHTTAIERLEETTKSRIEELAKLTNRLADSTIEALNNHKAQRESIIAAQKEWIRLMTRWNESLRTVYDSQRTKIESLGDAYHTAAGKVTGAATTAAEAITEATSESAKQVSELRRSLLTAVRTDSRVLTKALDDAERVLVDTRTRVATEADEASVRLARSMNDWTARVSETVAAIEPVSGATRALSSSITSLRDSVLATSAQVKDVNVEVSRTTSVMRGSLEGLEKAVERLDVASHTAQEAVGAGAKGVEREVAAISAIVNDFVTILKFRINELASGEAAHATPNQDVPVELATASERANGAKPPL